MDEIITAEGMTITKYRKLSIADDPQPSPKDIPVRPKQSGRTRGRRRSTKPAGHSHNLRPNALNRDGAKPPDKGPEEGVEQQSDSSKASLQNGDSSATAASSQSEPEDEVPSPDELPSTEAANPAHPDRTEQKEGTDLELSPADVQNCQQNEGAVDEIITSRPGYNHSNTAPEEPPGTDPSPIIEQIGTANSAVETIKKSLAWAKSATQSGQLKFPPDLSLGDIYRLDPEPLVSEDTDSVMSGDPNPSMSKPKPKAPSWLCDNLIFFLLRHMLMDKEDVQVLDPLSTRSPKENLCLDSDARTIMAPLNENDNHRSLVVFNIAGSDGQIVCYDTVDGTTLLIERVKSEIRKLGREIRWQSPSCVDVSAEPKILV